MPDPFWGLPLPRYSVAPGPVATLWLLAVEIVLDAKYLRIEAQGEWSILPGRLGPCGPDGHLGLALAADRLIVADCPPGTLIGKFGGSAASLGTTDPKPFAIGSLAVIAIPEKGIGSLFIGFNGVSRPCEITRTLTLDVWRGG